MLQEVVAAQIQDLLSRPRWLVAYSGGLDSTVLLHLLWTLLKDRPEPALLAVHVHHGLSDRANSWQHHCQAQCSELGISFQSVSVAIAERPPQGLEAAARQARYDALHSLLRPRDALFLGHHRDDQVETVLLRLFRTSGVEGLAGMAPRSEQAGGLRVRPLLDVPRAQLRRYARAHGLRWIEDESNADRRYSRNFIRHRLLPVISEHWPQGREQLLSLSRSAADSAQLLQEVAREDLCGVVGESRWGAFVRLSAWGGMSSPRIKNALNAWLHQQGLPALRQRQWPAFFRQLLRGPEGASRRLDIAGGSLRCYCGALYFVPLQTEQCAGFEASWDLGQVLCLGGGGSLASGGGTGMGLLPGRYDVRFCRGGERVFPAGARRVRPLKDYLHERGVPPWWRDRTPLLYREGQLAAVADLCVCEGFSGPPGAGPGAGRVLCWRP